MTLHDSIMNYYTVLGVRAMRQYNRRYNNVAFLRATSDSERACALIDEAMALCGHPSFSINRGMRWTEEELEFLALFCEENN